jgi:hypothetical protein
MPLTIKHAKSVTLADFTGTVTVNNSSGGTTTCLATDLARPVDWNSAHNITVSLTGSEIASMFTFQGGLTTSTNATGLVASFDPTFIVAGTGINRSTATSGVSLSLQPMSFFEPFPLPNTNSTLSSPGIGTWYLDGPYVIDAGLDKGLFFFPVSNAAGFLHGTTFSAANTGSVTVNQTLYHHLALYKQGAGASTSRLETVWTGSIALQATWSKGVSSSATSHCKVTNALTLSFPAQWDSTGGVTYSTTAQSGTTESTTSTLASTFANNLITGAVAYVSGARMDVIGNSSTLAPGVYWLAHMFTSTSSSAGTNYSQGTAFSTQSRLGFLENNLGAYKRLGLSVSNSSTGFPSYHGYLQTTTSQATSIINTSDIRATTGRAYWNFAVSTY